MFQNYGYPMSFNSFPTATQPYGFPVTNPINQSQLQSQPQSNIIYVNGIDDVKNRQLPNNSNFVFMDNDNPIIYRKTVDGQGKMSVEAFDIVPHKDVAVPKPEYALKSDIEALKGEILKLKTEVTKNDIARTYGTANEIR